MDETFLERGLIIGLSIAAPVGPISLLCIHKTLAEGRLSGIVSGLGAATSDAAYGCVAGFGITIISNTLIGQQTWLRLIGGLLLCYLGIKQLLARPAEQAASRGRNGLIGTYAQTLFLTLTNPMTILSFGAFFASMGLMNTGASLTSAGALVTGVFIGSLLWWIILSFCVGAFRERLDERALKWVDRTSAAIIAGFGLAALMS